MNDTAISRGLTASDLAFLTDHCRDTALATGGVLEHLPHFAEAMSDACVSVRVRHEERTRALAVAVDRGVERQVFVVTVQFAARGTGIARHILLELVRDHVRSRPGNRAVASVWPGVRGGAGLLLGAGFDTGPGHVRFSRHTIALEPAAPPPPLRWLEIDGESPEKRGRLAATAAHSWPGDADLAPTLTALAESRLGKVIVGFAGNDAKVVCAGHGAGKAFNIVAWWSAESVRDHGPAEHALARIIASARAAGFASVLLETTVPCRACSPRSGGSGFGPSRPRLGSTWDHTAVRSFRTSSPSDLQLIHLN